MPHFNDSKKDATHAVDIVFDSVTRAVSKGDEVNIAGF
jgi:DNA-binding protein HU-beta